MHGQLTAKEACAKRHHVGRPARSDSLELGDPNAKLCYKYQHAGHGMLIH